MRMVFTRSSLAGALSAGLPGAEAHRRMLPAGRKWVAHREVPAGTMESGVLVLLFPVGDRVFTCLIKRPGHMKVHAGQIGFPGGRREPSDRGTLETALREAREETGIADREVEVLGALTPLYISVSSFLIYPWLAWSEQAPRFTPNPAEAEKILLFPLPAGREGLPVVTATLESVTGSLTAPSLLFEGEIIWGATAMILSEVAEITARVSGLPAR